LCFSPQEVRDVTGWMQEAVLIVFSRVFRKYVIYPIDLVREVLRVPCFCFVRQYVILSTTHRLPTHYLLCYDCAQKVRYLCVCRIS
jgi:hypothetical protein